MYKFFGKKNIIFILKFECKNGKNNRLFLSYEYYYYLPFILNKSGLIVGLIILIYCNGSSN